MSKNFRAAMSARRGDQVTQLDEQGQEVVLGVIGPVTANSLNNPFREKLEKEAAQSPIQELSISQLQDNPFQHLARNENDESMGEAALEELADSIKQNGFYGALLARRKPGTFNQYELVYGHRRKAASIRAGLSTLPV